MEEYENKLNKTVKFLKYGATLIVASYVAWFFIYQGRELSDDPGNWGEFGDYIGGILNPFVSFFTLLWLTYSVRLQKVELAETRQELAKTTKAQAEAAEAQMKNLKIQADILRLTKANHLASLKLQKFAIHYEMKKRGHGFSRQFEEEIDSIINEMET